MKTRTVIVTTAPTATSDAIATLVQANGRPVMVDGARVFGFGATVEEAVVNLNRNYPVRRGETRKGR